MKLPEKIEISRKFACKNRNFVGPARPSIPLRSLLFHFGHPRSRSLRLMERGYSLFLFTVLPQARPVHSRWLAPLWYGPYHMGFHWHSDCSTGLFPTHATLV